MASFVDVFEDVTKLGRKIPTTDYAERGAHPIIDQGQDEIAGYTDETEGLFTDVPAIIFGDHTRVIKYVDKPCFLGADGVKLLKVKLPEANYRYLYYVLQNARIPNTGYNRHFKWLKEVEIPLPDAHTQTAIVTALDKLTTLISLRKQQIAKLDELVKARFVEMFGDPVSNPKGWEMAQLSSLAEIKIGPFGSLLHKEDYVSDEHPLVNPSHIVDGRIVVDNELTVNDAKYEEMVAYHLHPGDVVLGRRGEMGRCAVVYEQGMLCGTGSLIIRPSDMMHPYFLQKIISYPTFKKAIEDMAVGVTMMNLNVPIVSSFMIPVLPRDQQDAYLAFVTQTDQQKLTIQHSLAKLELLKKALMQKYFG